MNFYMVTCESGDINRITFDPDGELQFDVLADDRNDTNSRFIIGTDSHDNGSEVVEHIRRVKLYPNYLVAEKVSEEWLDTQGLI